MAMPISDRITDIINSEFPRCENAGYSIADYLTELYTLISAYRYASPLQRRFEYDPDDLESVGLDVRIKFGYYHGLGGGAYYGVNSTTVTLTDNTTNYVYVNSAENIVSGIVAPGSDCIPLYTFVTLAGAIVSYVDLRTTISIVDGQIVNADHLSSTIAERLLIAGFAVGAEASNEIQVISAIATLNGDAISSVDVGREEVEIWLSDTAGAWETAAAPNVGFDLAAGGGTILETITADKRLRIEQTSAGAFVASVRHVGAGTWYLNAIVNGRLYSSAAITFS